MTRPTARSVFERQPPAEKDTSFPVRSMEVGVVGVEGVGGGMVTAIAKSQIPNNSFNLVRNGRTREHWVGRRPGLKIFTNPPAGLSDTIIGLITFFSISGGFKLLLVSESAAWLATSTGDVDAGDTTQWQQLTDDGGDPTPDFLSNAATRITAAQWLDWIFLANGVTSIHYVDVSTSKILPIDEAPRARFLTTYAERVVVANLRAKIGGVQPSGIAWSANGDPFEWDILDEDDIPTGAGEEQLIQSPSDANDAITGIFGLEREMVILRERSIWHASRQPFAVAPFRFTPIIAGLGCDLPYTAKRVEGGIIYADYRTKGVYFYTPGTRPVRISRTIDDELFIDLQNLRWAESAFDAHEQEYHLGLAIDSSSQWITKRWVFSMRNQSWVRDDGLFITTMNSLVDFSDLLVIDDLIGTIDAQVGVIDDLSGVGILPKPGIIMSTIGDEIITFNEDTDTDIDGNAFQLELISQNLGHPFRQRIMQDLVLRYEASRPGHATLQNSKDGVNWYNTKSFDVISSPEERAIGLAHAPLEGRGLYWRLVCESSDIKLNAYSMRYTEKSMQRQDEI